MDNKTKLLLMCFTCFGMIFLDFMLFNVHISKLYVHHLANLYPSNITIAPLCTWAKNNSFNFSDYKPKSFRIISRMLSVTYRMHGIIPIIRDGSFLHTFRQKKTDMDMDIYLIIPKNMTIWDAYARIRDVIDSETEFRNITLETQNVLLAGLFFDKSDAIRISFNGKKITDVNVLHETFLNDPDLQVPCLKQMECKRTHENDAYIEANKHHILTKNLFESLCSCDYMDSSLFCFDLNGEKYLEIRYGKNFTSTIPGAMNYSLIYERPHTTWRYIISNAPFLMKVKRVFEGHLEEKNKFNNDTFVSTTAKTTHI